MEISKAFRDVMRRKYKKLKQEEAQDATTQPKVGPTEAPSISDVQKKIYEVSKNKRKYVLPFRIYNPDRDEIEDADIEITAQLSKNEDKALKEIIDELKAAFDTQDADNISFVVKEIYKVLRIKAKDYSDEFLKALFDLFEGFGNIAGLYQANSHPSQEALEQAQDDEERRELREESKQTERKYKKIVDIIGQIELYLGNVSKRKASKEFESDALPSMELLGEKGTRRQRAQQLINLVRQGRQGAQAPPIDPNDPELLEVLGQLEGEEEEEGAGRRRKAKKQVGGKKKAK